MFQIGILPIVHDHRDRALAISTYFINKFLTHILILFLNLIWIIPGNAR